MVIKERILYKAGASLEIFGMDDIIFKEGSAPKFYFQIIEGSVKLNNYSEGGKESIQLILEKGNSIGESLLFVEKLYPVNAVATSVCSVLKLEKGLFFNLLNEHPQICLDMNRNISNSLYFKFIMNQNNSSQDPVVKLITLMDYLKSLQPQQEPFTFQVPLTRQQMANLTGLRVETTIRTIKIMEKERIVKIQNRKILY